MPHWDAFPRFRWRRDFGLRPRDRIITAIDGNQLELSWEFLTAVPHEITALENLRALFERCRWSQHDFARTVLGCHERTLQRYLAGGRIPEDRSNWIRRLETVALHGERCLIVVRCGTPVRWLPVWRVRKTDSGVRIEPRESGSAETT